MKSLACLVILLSSFSLTAAPASTNAAAASTNAAAATNALLILADDGFDYSAGKAIYRGNVQAIEQASTLTCEWLTLYFETNAGQIEVVIAETNVFITREDTLAIADRAVYTLTNDLLVLTGNVLLDTPQGYLAGPTVFYYPQSGKMHAPGKVLMGGHPGSGLMGTNWLGIPMPGTRRPTNAPPRPLDR